MGPAMSVKAGKNTQETDVRQWKIQGGGAEADTHEFGV